MNQTSTLSQESFLAKIHKKYLYWINEDWLALFIGLLMVLLALLGLLDWVVW